MIKIIVDSNIVFSAILNTQTKIAQLILDGSRYFDFYSINQLKRVVLFHKKKIMAATGYDEDRFVEIFELIAGKISFIDDIFLTDDELKNACGLVSDVDENDMMFVALTDHLKALLWTGDKELIKGLET